MKPAAQLQDTSDIFLQMHRLFKRLQQRNRFVDIEPASALTLAEAHLLKQCVTQPELTQAGYQKLFSLAQSHIARIIDRLHQRGLVSKKIDPNDSRAVRIGLTDAGKAAVSLSDKTTKESFDSLSRFLSKKEKSELTKFFKEIADGYGHPEAKLRPNELEYSLHQRRITRCFRLLGKRVFDSEFNSTQWQLLSALTESPVPMAASSLALKIGITNGAATIVIKDLIKRKLVLAVTNRLDKRALSISITPAGRNAIAAVEQTAADELRHALRKHSAKQCREWLSLLRKYVVDSDESMAVSSLGLSTIVFLTAEERAQARAQIVTALVEQQLVHECPSVLVAEDNIVVGFKSDRQNIIALFDMVSDGKAILVTSGFFDPKYGNSQRIQIADALKRYLKGIKPGQKLICEFVPLTKFFN